MVDSPEILGIITYTKRSAIASGEVYPPFVPCEVAVSKIETGIACRLDSAFFGANVADCSNILTEDFDDYIMPAVGCLAIAGGPPKVGGCLACLITANSGLLSICATDNSSAIRETCKSQCYDEAEECEVKLQTSLLCVGGSQVEPAPDGSFFGGTIANINGDYTCPAMDSSSDE